MQHKEPTQQKKQTFDPLPRGGMTPKRAERLADTPVNAKPKKSANLPQ